MQPQTLYRLLFAFAYTLYGFAGLCVVLFALIWYFGGVNLPIPDFLAIVPDDAYEPLTFLLGVASGGSGWIVGRIAEKLDTPAFPIDITLDPRLRQHLLATLATRYTKVQVDSLEQQVRIILGLKTRPKAVAPGWPQHLRYVRSQRTIPSGTPIVDVFDEAGGQLLILGLPGAGKTTLLLELAQALLARAQADQQKPIPVLVNLAEWAKRSGPLDRWLSEALYPAANLSKPFAQQLLAGRHLLLLLDGLDEVAASKRVACITAINDYCKTYSPMHIAVCSRTSEYNATRTLLDLMEAIEIVPIHRQRVFKALKQHSVTTAGLRGALAQDAYLRDLLTTPLMVHMAILAYAGQTVQAVAATSKEQRQKQLFTAYVRRMFQQRRATSYTPRQIMRGLHWLAAKMQQDAMTDFLLERMQPRWLPSLRGYRLLSGLCFGLGFGIVGVLGTWLSGGMVFGAGIMLVGALVGALGGGLNTTIMPDVRLTWSWPAARAGVREWLVVGLVGGLVGGLVVRWTLGLLSGLAVGSGSALIVALLGGLNSGFMRKEPEIIHRPNQGIWASLHNGLLRGLVVGLVFGLVIALIVTLVVGLIFGLVVALDVGLRTGLGLGRDIGLLAGLISGLLFGLGAFFRHYLLRFLLARAGLLPWDAVGFLDTACALLFLQRDGGIYRFRHMLLRDYFASLTPEEIAELAREGEEDGDVMR